MKFLVVTPLSIYHFFFYSESGLVLDIITPWLSPHRAVGILTGTPRDLKIQRITIASSVANLPVHNYHTTLPSAQHIINRQFNERDGVIGY